jgi:predicted RNase H-like nuclease
VYPHPALIELSAATRRLPHKHSKSRKYWPDDAPMGRRLKLFATWEQIVLLLEDKVKGVAAALPLPDLGARAYELKAFEDALDAVVCAWIGACVIDGLARSYGDDSSAIWVPNI